MTQTFRIGLLGASRIAPGAVIGPARQSEGFEVTVVAARDLGRARAFAREHEIAGVAEDYAALIARDDVDVVYNALPPAGHARWSIAAIHAGKAVLCEKPFARNAGEAVAMVEAARANGAVLIEAFHYRFHAVIRHAEALVRGGGLGALRRGAARFVAPIAKAPDELRWRADQGGGAMMDLGCYPLHALRTLIGAEPQVVSAEAVFEAGVDTSMSARVRFPGGVDAELACSMTPERPAARLTLEGEKGSMEILNFMAPQMGCRFTTTIDDVTQAQPTEGLTSYAAQLAHLHAVLTGAATPLTGGDDAIANMIAIDAIYAASGRAEPTRSPR